MILEQLRKEIKGQTVKCPSLKFKPKKTQDFLDQISPKKSLKISMKKTFCTGREDSLEKSNDFVFDFKGSGSIDSSPKKSISLWKSSLFKSADKRNNSNIRKGLKQSKPVDVYSQNIRKFMNPLPINGSISCLSNRSKSVIEANK
mmetsp:Transcript_10662/g.10525  ORF Transcript_10662/g.10525 Transcript_10662/m.10525 type:complete len:145 (+) Transcript_10662:40-474(+)